MAKAEVFIPDGEFCCDNSHLDCLYADHDGSTHICRLYLQRLMPLESFFSNGNPRRAYRKCNLCIQNMVADRGNGIKVD